MPEAGFEVDPAARAGHPAAPHPREHRCRRRACSSPASLRSAIVVRRRPRVVVTVGGYAGLPCAVAAIVLRVPLVVVSYDAVPGASNRLVARFARKCAVAFEGTRASERGRDRGSACEAVLRADRSPAGRERRPRAHRRLPPGRPLLAVAGGSLGARRLNEAALGLARAGPPAATSRSTTSPVSGTSPPRRRKPPASASARRPRAGRGLDYRLVGYERQMPALLAACDLAVCRAGRLDGGGAGRHRDPERPRAPAGGAPRPPDAQRRGARQARSRRVASPTTTARPNGCRAIRRAACSPSRRASSDGGGAGGGRPPGRGGQGGRSSSSRYRKGAA